MLEDNLFTSTCVEHSSIIITIIAASLRIIYTGDASFLSSALLYNTIIYTNT